MENGYTIAFDQAMGNYIVSTPVGKPKAKLKRTRRNIGYAIMKHIKDRVLKRGEGANGKLKPYSTKPFIFKKSIKPMWGDTELEGTVIKGGYAQYRADQGLPNNHFMFSNKGNAWNDWDFVADDNTGEVTIGFSQAENAFAAEMNQIRRPDLFDINDRELDMILDGIIDDFEREFIGE